MAAYLIDHPPRIRQFRERGTTISGVLEIHTAENVPDTIATDGGAEAVARFIQGRTDPGCYHWLADSDSLIDLVPMTLQTWGDGTGLNPHVVHISAATQAAKWASLPKDWVDGTVRNMALAAHKASNKLFQVHGVRVPARFVTRAEAGNRKEGFIAHGTSDPTRRSDPGATFPWDKFFTYYRELEARKTKPAPAPAEKPDPPAAEPDAPTRGKLVDDAIAKTSAAIRAVEKAKGTGDRQQKLEVAAEYLHASRKHLRDVGIINAGGGSSDPAPNPREGR